MRKTPMRRPHRKTKTGCLQCRQRKIKCDEERPACRYCVRHSSRCSYTTEVSSPSASLSSTRGKTSPSSEPSLKISDIPASTEAIDVCSNITWDDLELLHHFTTSTSLTIIRKPEHEAMWQISVPQLALQQPFLMRGIFALSALHLAYLRPDRREQYIVVAANHEDVALQAYRSVLLNINKENCDAVFAFSALVVAYSLGSRPTLASLLFAGPDSLDRSNAIPEWLHLIRGNYTILQSVGPWIKEGSMVQLIQNVEGAQDTPRSVIEDAQLAKLLLLFEPTAAVTLEAQERNEIYKVALQDLRMAFSNSYPPEDPGYCMRWASFRWPVKVSEAYIILLSRREPEALVLLAHECVLLKRERPCWYMDDHATRLMSVIKESLGDEWRRWIEWPLKEIET